METQHLRTATAHLLGYGLVAGGAAYNMHPLQTAGYAFLAILAAYHVGQATTTHPGHNPMPPHTPNPPSGLAKRIVRRARQWALVCGPKTFSLNASFCETRHEEFTLGSPAVPPCALSLEDTFGLKPELLPMTAEQRTVTESEPNSASKLV